MSDSDLRIVRVLLADSRPLESQLLTAALEHHGFQVFSCAAELSVILELLNRMPSDVLLVSSPASPAGALDTSILRSVHLAKPYLPKIAMLNDEQPDVVVQAFRSGARGIVNLADSSFQLLCDCVQQVYAGRVWASNTQLLYLLDSVCQTPGVNIVNATGDKLLTSREEQVVALVADGMSNRNIATELGLSEHTVKKYLFRIFEKLGISNRVELVLYAVHHGAPLQSEWVASA